MIDLVQLMTKQELAVKPNKVVAGLEPEYTNIFLQGSKTKWKGASVRIDHASIPLNTLDLD